MKRLVLSMLLAVMLAACETPPPPQTAENTVGGANVKASLRSPFTKSATSLALDLPPQAVPGDLVIVDLISYGGPTLAITPPSGWDMVREEATTTTRQTLFSHLVQPNESGRQVWGLSRPADGQLISVILDNVSGSNTIDLVSGNTGFGGSLTAKSILTHRDGDLILAFMATDFGRAPLHADVPHFMARLLAEEAAPNEFWILKTYQDQAGLTDEAVLAFPQVFNWSVVQVAITKTNAASPSPRVSPSEH
jgi:hypothetical protein